VKEEILLNDFLGKNIKVRYTLVSDDWANYDGFYFDDVTITKLDMTTGLGRKEVITGCSLSDPIPNPAVNRVSFRYGLPQGTGSGEISFLDAQGIAVGRFPLNNDRGSVDFNLESFSPGIYFCKLASPGSSPVIRKLVVIR
jgi:hypothetical protein